jgi:hypothetical protein
VGLDQGYEIVFVVMVFFILERKAGLGIKVKKSCELQINRTSMVEMVNKTCLNV